jgi:ethanolaminephosphotransferase
MSAIITTVAFTFKLAFTTADSPELVHSLSMLGSLGNFLNNYSLVLHARFVFLGTAAIVLVGIYALTSIASTDKQGK